MGLVTKKSRMKRMKQTAEVQRSKKVKSGRQHKNRGKQDVRLEQSCRGETEEADARREVRTES